MHLDSLFEEQRAVEERQRLSSESAIPMLRIATGGSFLALPLENAREVVRTPHIVSYPVELGHHVGIVNVRGTVIPVVSLGKPIPEADQLVVIESPNRHRFALMACGVRRITITDPVVGAQSRSAGTLTGVIRVCGKPVRWVSVAWLVAELFNKEINASID